MHTNWTHKTVLFESRLKGSKKRSKNFFVCVCAYANATGNGLLGEPEKVKGDGLEFENWAKNNEEFLCTCPCRKHSLVWTGKLSIPLFMHTKSN